MKLGSLFSGSGSFELSGALFGIEPVWSSEIDPFCLRVESARFPNCKQLGSVKDINGANIEPVDVITFGSPCFPAETLVLTEKGYIPICDVRVGMKVLTHTGEWHNVTAVGAKPGNTVILKGNHYGLECTRNHPIYSAGEKKDYSRKKDGSRQGRIVLTDERNWIHAENMEGKLWAVPNAVETITASIPDDFPIERIDDLFYFVGRWLGDGWVRDGQRPDRRIGCRYAEVYLCDSKDKLCELIDAVTAISEKYSIEEVGNSVKIKFHSQKICNWLTENFGKYADGKTMPGWVFGMNKSWQENLMRGIIDSDGHTFFDRNEHRISTVSKKLAESIRLLGEILGYSTTVYFQKTKDHYVIENRVVNQKDYYVVALHFNNKRTHLSDESHGWYRVRSVSKGRETTVWNITVDNDNSYIADGIVVHNCQDLSLAGKQAGIHEGARSSLFFEAIRIIQEMRNATANQFPRFAVWENVLGCQSSHKGADFRAVIEALVHVADPTASIPMPDKGKWFAAGCVVGEGYSLAWNIYDAQYSGVPQRRKRVYLITDYRSERAGEILFKPSRLRWDSEEGRQAEQRASAYIAGSPGGGRWFRWWQDTAKPDAAERERERESNGSLGCAWQR